MPQTDGRDARIITANAPRPGWAPPARADASSASEAAQAGRPAAPSPAPKPSPPSPSAPSSPSGAQAGPDAAHPARSTGQPIIVARGVRKTYESGRLRVEALRGVDLTVRRGEMVAVMGPSGCGKTTLLNCLSGLDDLSGGDVALEGKALAGLSDLERTRLRSRRMGFVFQSFNLLPVLTALENVELPLLVSGVKPAETARRARQALERVGLAPFVDHKPRELSGGQQQRVALARSLVNEPAIVWADEPTGNLDTQKGREVLELMHRLNRELGQTYIIVTHDEAVAASCHRIIHMADGRIVREAPGRGQVAPRAS